ncbi:Pvc16 family protein [Nocardia sp. XZ_19_385]|uniref:Pvc16 family protein n=1 Tax=Nocardia sp. XZ_19_385 TaxID=2769488 RepID=UPI00188E492B|nr:Pvc16 family protein [Nocardia sp. XZ_19_385]
MFHDLDATLAGLLSNAAAPAELRAAEISFRTPDKDFTPTPPTVNLFLHAISENRELRSSVPIMDRVDDHFLPGAPPMRVDCTYLITAWSNQSGEVKIATEHKLLGATLLWLSTFRVIPDTALVGSLKEPPQRYPVPTALAMTTPEESLAHLWSALGTTPRPTLTLTITIGIQAPGPLEPIGRVEKIDIEGMSRTHPELTGRVFDAGLAAVPGATVSVLDRNLDTSTDAAGRFRFRELPFGDYTLRVQVPGRPEVTHPVTYRETAQIHPIFLS